MEGSLDLTMEMLIRVARTLRLRSGFAGYIHLKIIPGCSPLLAPEKTCRDILGLMRSLRGIIEQARTERLPSPRSWPERPSLGSAQFAPAGQSTQLVVGASPESDRHILLLAENLYDRCRLRRLYYSAFAPVGPEPRLPALGSPPLRHEHRLYQADWLPRFYDFSASEVLDEALLRVPGLGQKSARRIVDARRHGRVGFDTLERIVVVMRRARWFITCGGRLLEPPGPSDGSFPSIIMLLTSLPRS